MSRGSERVVDLEAFVTEVRSDPMRREELLPLLHEGHPVYQGRGENAAIRARGWVMAAFETVGLPPGALPAVLETLQTGLNPYAVAAAARAARGTAAPARELCQALVTALVGIRGHDDRVSFASLCYTAPDPGAATALMEVLQTLRAYGAAAHAVHADLVQVRDEYAPDWSAVVRAELDAAITATARAPLSLTELSRQKPTVALTDRLEPVDPHQVWRVGFEDQAGRVTTFEEHFNQWRNVVAFFYTRCGNPAKCSATVTRLAELARRLPTELPDETIGVVGISYDPGYDNPQRLAAYGSARGMPFSDSVRLMRAPEGHELLRRYFDLKVGYADTLVNQHAIELYLLGADGRVQHAWSRSPWEVDEVLDVLTRSSPHRPQRGSASA
jgi:protein SCO1/2